MNHLMVDLIIINEKQSSPLLAIEAVFFEPSTGQIGKSFYSPINIRMATRLINVDTAFEWMKKDSHWRAELMSATEAEEGVMCDLAGFICVVQGYPGKAGLIAVCRRAHKSAWHLP